MVYLSQNKDYHWILEEDDKKIFYKTKTENAEDTRAMVFSAIGLNIKGHLFIHK